MFKEAMGLKETSISRHQGFYDHTFPSTLLSFVGTGVSIFWIYCMLEPADLKC